MVPAYPIDRIRDDVPAWRARPTLSVALVTALVAAAAHLVTRTWLLFRFRWVGSDTYYHFIIGSLLRTKRRLPFSHDRFIRPELVDYPPFLPVLSAVWPPKRFRELQFVAPAADFFTLLAVGLSAFWIGGMWASSIAMVVYASTPYAFDMTYSFNARPVANLFMTLSLGSLLLFDSVGLSAVFAAGLFGGFVLLTHRLTTQSYLAVLVAVGIFAPLEVAYTLAVAIIVAMAVSRGVYATTLRGHVAFIREMRNARFNHVSRAVTIAKILAGNPHLALVAFVATAQWQSLPIQGRVLTLAIAALWLLAALWPFGEGDRHFANASSLTAFAASFGDWSGGPSVLLLGTVAIGMVLVAAKLVKYPDLAKQGASTVVTSPIREACTAVRAESIGGRQPLVLTCPQSLSYQVMFFADARGVVASGGTGVGLAYNSALESRLLRLGLPGLLDAEVPDFIVCLETHKPSGLANGWAQMFHSEGVEVYRRNRTIGAHTASGRVGSAGG